MIDLLSVSHTILREQRFLTRVIGIGKSSALSFEDETLLGFIYVFDSAIEMIEGWQSVEKSFLQSNASRFRGATDKAWNVYSVFISGANAEDDEKRKIRWIEEDLRYTRKLTGCAVGTRQDLSNVLLPLLPLQQKPFLQTDSFRSRLQRRLLPLAGGATDALLNESLGPHEIVRLLRDIS